MLTNKERYQKRRKQELEYNRTHKDIVLYRQNRSHAKKFIREATQEDLRELRDLLKQYLK